MQAETWTQIQEEIGRALETEVYGQTRVQGGDISEAYRVELQSGGYIFVKAHESAAPGMFAAEADGLVTLDTVHGVRVPRVLAHGDKWLALEWIEAGKRDAKSFDEALGRGVAMLHKHRTELGHTRDNFIGVLKQDNTPTKTWTEFFGARRLLPLARLGVESAKLPLEVEQNIVWLCQRLSAFIGDEDAPSQLHGDLWGGNVMCDASGAPVLVDPAVYGGDREVDLAMMRLFGNFSPRVFSAYAEAFPLRPGSEERIRLYQLYPLLVHACMFGGGYVEQVKTLVTSLI